jgi:pimeloyl-ACP methyl ester carboxylesterase
LNSVKKIRIMQIALIVIGALLVVYIGLSVYGAWRAMNIPHFPLVASPTSVGLDCEDVSFGSRDGGVTLRGWFLPGKGDSVILIVNGGFQNRVDDNVDTLSLTRDLIDKGYSVLLFDLRGRGESEGKGQALSNIEYDIGGAVDYLESRGYGPENTSILGFCSGAASTCIFASRNEVRAVILDGCFIDVPTMVVREAARVGLPEFLVRMFVPGLVLMTRLIYHYQLINPGDIVADIRCPVFFICEELDPFITPEDNQRLCSISGKPANRIWEVAGAEHSQSYRTFPEEYIRRVDDFIRGA